MNGSFIKKEFIHDLIFYLHVILIDFSLEPSFNLF